MKSSLANSSASASAGNASTSKGNRDTSNAASSHVSVESLDTNFLPLVYDVVRSIEKEVHEMPPLTKTTTSRESQEYHLKVQLLKDKLETVRSQVGQIKGIEVSREEQLKRVDLLKNQLAAKRDLLAKYKNQCPIEGIQR